jgi:polyisoprenoid-binding protein YceI
MMLKNRLTAFAAVAAIAVPALAFAAAKYSKAPDVIAEKKFSSIAIVGTAPGVSFTATADSNNINVDDDGTVIKVSIDGTKLKTGMGLRDEHMRKQVFGKGKTVVLTVTHADLDAGLKSHKVKGTLKFSDKPAKPITITDVSLSGGVVKGKISTSRSELGIPEACMPPVNVPCVKDPLEVDATILIKTG